VNAAQPIPLTVIGGYLGAGKTTLVNEILKDPEGRRYGVVVNDLGAVSIDSALIEQAVGGMVTLSNGCVCCSAVDGFASALDDIRDHGARIDHVIVEVSGVGDPWKVAQWGRSPGFELDAVIVLADAEALPAQVDDPYIGETVLGQLRGADVVVLSKIDLVGDGAEDVRDWVASLTPAQVVASAQGTRFGAAMLAATHGPSHRGVGSGSSHAAHVTRTITEPGALAPAGWFDWLSCSPRGVVRVKGIVVLDDDRMIVVQRAGHRVEVSAWNGERRSPALVVIASEAVDEAALDRWVTSLSSASHRDGSADEHSSGEGGR